MEPRRLRSLNQAARDRASGSGFNAALDVPAQGFCALWRAKEDG